ncbi:MAG: hypothetical protein KBA97_09835 [Methanothrix sp.]|nr:hypothetical protein [Methanothrix sp.]
MWTILPFWLLVKIFDPAPLPTTSDLEMGMKNQADCSRLHRHIAKYLPLDHSKFLPGNDGMRLFMLCILVLSLTPLSSAVVDLSGQSGKDVLSSIESGSGLWNWGSVPLGHVVNDSQLLPGVRKDPRDISTMETPLQAQGSDSSGLIAPIMSGFSDGQTPTQAANNGWIPIVSGYDDMNPMDKKAFKSPTGVFDLSFKGPTIAQFPRVY